MSQLVRHRKWSDHAALIPSSFPLSIQCDDSEMPINSAAFSTSSRACLFGIDEHASIVNQHPDVTEVLNAHVFSDSGPYGWTCCLQYAWATRHFCLAECRSIKHTERSDDRSHARR
ncbi:hypothetical protein D3C87_1168060 [compost metagenome]